MYFVKYGNEWLHDPREYGMILSSLSLESEENTCGYCTFQIDKKHPLCGAIEQRNSSKLITVYDDKLGMEEPYFEGYVYEVDTNFYLSDTVKCRGVLSYLSDTIVRPYSTLAEESRNVAPSDAGGYFTWLLDTHNSQCGREKRFREGLNQASRLDANNYIYRANSNYTTVADEMKAKLLDELGGYLNIRYDDGVRYLDYISEWEDANTQLFDFGVNLLDFTRTDDSANVVTAVIPLGASMSETKYSYAEDEADTKLTISAIANGNVNSDIVKAADYIYSKKAVGEYGWVFGVYENTDITVRENLLTSGVSFLGSNVSPQTTITVKAIDLSMINPKYKPIRVGEYVRVRSTPHNFDSYMLCTNIDLDLVNPENSTYTLGFTYDTISGLSNRRINALNATVNHVYQTADAISQEAKAAAEQAAAAESKASEASEGVADLEQKFATLKGKFLHIRYSARADGSDMTDAPTTDTKYMGIYSGDSETAPEKAAEYVWSLIKGNDGVGVKGEDGAPAYLHIKYSDDGKTFTANGGETAGEWLGTYSDNIKADSTTFSDYVWVKVKGERGEQGLRGLQGEDGERGIQGEAGSDGKPSYFHIKYSPVANPTAAQMTETPDVYIGTYVDNTQADSTSPSAYTWARFQGMQGERGEQGIAGVGSDGRTSYLHIKYSDDGGKTFTAENGEAAGDYIGTCTDFTANDPTTVGSYKWARIKGDKGSVTFTDTPTTPYFVGDMWTVQASGDKLGEGTLPFALETRAAIYVCIKDSEGAFSMDDWSLAGTDDSVAQEAANNAAAALDTAASALQKALEDSSVVKIETLYSADGGATWTTEQPTQ